MSEINRRAALGTGAAALAATGLSAQAANATVPADTAGGGNPFLFRLTRSAPDNYHGGSLRGAHEKDFPVLAGQQASVYFVHLDVGGMREPHWHPSAWELNFIISGTADWVVLGTHADGSYHNERFRAGQGDLVFAPQGFFHYFGNASPHDPLQVLVIFNTSTAEPNDDIGILAALNSLPREVLATTFGVDPSAFAKVPKTLKPVVITKHS